MCCLLFACLKHARVLVRVSLCVCRVCMRVFVYVGLCVCVVCVAFVYVAAA